MKEKLRKGKNKRDGRGRKRKEKRMNLMQFGYCVYITPCKVRGGL